MYFYHGYALGVGSTIKGQQFTEASCALSARGGIASATSSSFSKFGISFDAQSNVSGSYWVRNGFYYWTTKADVVINNLKILNRVTADSIEGHVLSEFRAGDYEPNTIVAGSKFTNLRIDGTQVQPVLSDVLSEAYATYSSMQAAFSNTFTQPQVLATVEGRDLTPQAATTSDLHAAYESYKEQAALTTLKSAVISSLVTRVDNLPVGGSNWGPIISIPGFGRLYLGEVIVWPWMRCLTMLRVEVDGPANNLIGSVCCGSAGANGTGYPPGYGQGTDWP